jgi:hypothetical protein
MAKKNVPTKQDCDVIKFLRVGGGKIPAGLIAKARAVTKSTMQKKLNVATNRRLEGAKLYGELKGGSPIAVDDPANRKTLDAILRLHRTVASKRLPFPKVTAPFGGFPPGSIVFSGTRVPPFDFASPDSGSAPTFSTANTNGQISANVATPESGSSSGLEVAQVGIQFSPPVAGTLTISTTPSYSYEWSTNSLNTTPVQAFGSIMLLISAVNPPVGAQSGIEDVEPIFFQCVSGQIQFDFEFGVQQPFSASMAVNPALEYLCSVVVTAAAMGEGWPGSLAVAMVSATVPSISYSFVGLSGPIGPTPVR